MGNLKLYSYDLVKREYALVRVFMGIFLSEIVSLSVMISCQNIRGIIYIY